MSVGTVISLSTGYMLAFIGIFISLGIIIVTKMIADAFKLSKLKGWVSGEFKELLMTIFLVAFGMFILQFIVNSIALNIIGLPGSTSDLTYPPYYFYADNFLTLMYYKVRSLGFMAMMFTGHSIMGTMAGTTVSIPVVPVPTPAGAIIGCVETKPWESLALVSSQVSYVNKLWATNLILIELQKAFLAFIRETAFTIFFPLGIILRAFPITRKAGSTLIALAAVFFFMFPMMVILDSYLYDNFVWGPIDYQGEGITDVMQSYREFTESGEMSELYPEGVPDDFEEEPMPPEPAPPSPPAVFSWIWKMLSSISPWAANIIEVISGWFVNLSGIGANMLDFIEHGGNVNMYQFIIFPYRFMLNTTVVASYNLMFSIVCVLLNFVVTLTLFESISPLIGGEKSMFALAFGRLKKIG